jgi:exodeoxyribonuclease-3
MRLAAWNVNSLKVRLPHLLNWLQLQHPDVVCLQETKTEDVNFPSAAITDAGYKVVYTGQKTYNGVAILSRYDLEDVVVGMPGWEDVQQRVISATVQGVRVICVYVPNGQALDSEKYTYKLAWLEALQEYVSQQLLSHSELAVLGDYNIAPADEDVYDPKGWADGILVSAPERDALLKLLGLGLVDSFRLFSQSEKSYTWWDYRMAAFRRNMGARIDHILLSHDLAKRCVGCEVDVAPRKLDRPSDHAPIIVTIGAN